MYSDWERCYDKENWQRVTFERIKSRLISSKNNRFIRYDNTQKNHLVMVYGQAQVGKTTLILNMIGVSIKYYKEVDETLRAGVKHGNSSTSTAIIYSKSDNDEYGLAVSTVDDINISTVSYYKKSQMIEKLKEVRERVENNKQSSNTVLYIYIPKSYFEVNNLRNNISIVDLPGVESRNRKEELHVQNLMNKYLPISSVCLIVCQSSQIQSLGVLRLPNNADWKSRKQRFAIVVTKAFSDESSKNYFKERKKIKFLRLYNINLFRRNQVYLG